MPFTRSAQISKRAGNLTAGDRVQCNSSTICRSPILQWFYSL